MVTRAAGRKSSIAGGYTALGAGGRASAVTPLAPQAFETTEPYGESTAGDVYRQRTGLTATSGIVHLGIDALIQENADGLYDPEIGALGDTLARADVPRAVIANGDGAQPVVDDPLPEFQRSAVNALMGSDGHVPAGAVGDELLVDDPHAPFGVRMDNDAAYRAFSNAWQAGGVVLVEGSDLLRADLATDFLTDDQAKIQKQAALHRVDGLVGRMLADVDPAHDAVFVVSPASPRRGSGLAVTGIRAPGVQPEMLRSATSRRNGFVYVIDIAPTILQLLGLDPPAKMEGRPMEVVGGVAHGDRIDTLIHANEDAVFRDSKVVTANNIVLALTAALALAAIFVVAPRAAPCSTRAVPRARSARLPVRDLCRRSVAFRPQRQRRRVLRVPRGRSRRVRRRVPTARSRSAVPAARAGARRHRGRARGRSPGRRAARAQHGVRLLGDGRHPGLGPGQPHVRAAHRGGAAPRGPRGVATAWAHDGVRGDRHARGDVVGDGGAALRRRLRRRARRCPGLRAVRLDAARSQDPAAHGRDPRRWCWW